MTLLRYVSMTTVRSSESVGQALTSPSRSTMNLKEYAPVGVVALAGHALLVQEDKEGSVLSFFHSGPAATADAAWIKGELEATRQIAAGEYEVFDNADDFLAFLA